MLVLGQETFHIKNISNYQKLREKMEKSIPFEYDTFNKLLSS